MAIGDSLFNGVRSLTIDSTLAQWSAPAQLAKALGFADFASPDYPKNVVINFEQWIRDFPIVSSALGDLASNIAFWNTQPKSALAQFDNISIASSAWSDLYNRTWQTAQDEIDAINSLVSQGKSTYNDHLADLFFAFNTRFILNPSGDPNTPALAPIDIAAQRRPKRLIVSIGANNGLWTMAVAATACTAIDQPTGPFSTADLAQAQTFIEKLQALPPEIEHIYINTLPYPSDTATMMPTDDDDLDNKPGPGKFYAKYENRFGFNYNQLTAAQVAQNNSLVDQVNARVAGFATDPRIHFVPFGATLAGYDFKTDAAGKVIAAPDDRRPLSNIMIDAGADVDTGEDYWFGGLAGLDGVHPTIVGYNLMAQTILMTMKAVEPALATPGALPTVAEAYAADTLLRNVPDQWDFVVYTWRDIRQLFQVGEPAPAVASANSVGSLMKLVQFHTSRPDPSATVARVRRY